MACAEQLSKDNKMKTEKNKIKILSIKNPVIRTFVLI